MGRKRGKGIDRSARCMVSGKLTAGREVVLVDYAIAYVKMMGFVVLPSAFMDWETVKKLNVEVKHDV